ncbi:hypothetical protein BU15DRAFT_67552 [Melanogaster broomeanus]|nr:hypothetical protein BU15DRAFT_67552 [Melanogaster broomeanus]
MPPPSPTTFSITIAVNSYPRGQPHGQNDTAGELKSKRRSRFELEDPEELVEGSTPPKTRRLDDWEGASAADASSVGGILSKLVQEIEEMKKTPCMHTLVGTLWGMSKDAGHVAAVILGKSRTLQCSENSQIPPWYKLKTQKTKDDKLEAVPAKPTLGSNDPHNSLDHHHWFGRGACGMIVPLQLCVYDHDECESAVVSLCSEVEIELDRDGVDDAGEEGIGLSSIFGLAEQIAGRAHKYSGPDEPFSESGDNDMITGTDGPEVDKLQFSIW